MQTMDELLPFEFWKSERMEDIRNELMSGVQSPECFRCWRLEESGEESYRHRAIRAKEFEDDNKISLKLRIGSNFCNLACYMCNPKNSTTRKNELRLIYGDDHDKVFDQEFYSPYKSTKNKRWNAILENILENIEKVDRIHLTGGEPLQLPQQWKLLNSIPEEYAKNIKVTVDTNLTELGWKGNSIYDLRNKFKLFHLGISCDHYGDKLEFMRYPIDVQQFEKNLIEIRNAGFSHCLNITASILNIDDINRIKQYYSNMGINNKVHAIVADSIFSISNLPEHIKEEYIETYFLSNEPLIVAELECKRDAEKLKNGFRNLDDLSKHRKIEWRPLWSDFIKKIER
jgi:organic radical activating enzyme